MSTLQRFLQATGCEQLVDACEKAVSQFRSGYFAAATQFSPVAFCDKFGLKISPCKSAPFEGRLTYSADLAPVITIRSPINSLCRSTARFRFTLAHEIGHWIVHEVLNERRDSIFRGIPVHNSDIQEEETIADAIAAELLMPRHQFEEFLPLPLTHDLIARGLSRFEVSRQAFVRRHATLANTQVLFVEAIPTDCSSPIDSPAIIDDAWMASPDKPLTILRTCARFPKRIAFGDIQESGKHELPIEIGNNISFWNFDSQPKAGTLPVAKLIAASFCVLDLEV